MLEHGGALNAAGRRYGRPAEDWLDLSTGINPRGYPVPHLPPGCWRRLPEEDDGLEDAARACYGAPHALPVAGSQAAIQALPRLLPPGRVLLLSPSYAEHGAAWAAAGHELRPLPAARAESELEAAARDCAAVLLCHPNNPTGLRLPRERLLSLAADLTRRGARLVLDEAFMDATPEDSLAPLAGGARPTLVVLRSLGKFYGLAGLRVGFALAEPELLGRLREALGPWPLSGPSRTVARLALLDRDWQQAERQRLAREGQRLAALIRASGLGEPSGTALFQWFAHPRAAELHEALARRGILVRLFREPVSSLRIGLPDTANEWERLEKALPELEKLP